MWKFKLYLLVVFVGIMLVQSSCETDIDIIAPQRDVTIVYGILEANRTRQYIRINRGFIGEEAASELAKEPGINEYDDSELIVAQVIELDENGRRTSTRWDLSSDYITTKDTGAFASGSNKVYYFDASLDITRQYELLLKFNIADKDSVSAITGVIGSQQEVQLISPRRAVNNNEERLEVDFIGQGEYRNESTVEWSKVVGGVSYNAYYRFYYWEHDTITDKSVRDSITYSVGSRTLASDNDIFSEGRISFVINPEEFYTRIDDIIEDYNYDSDPFIRYASDTLQYFLEIADKELATYIRVNQPATEVLQERPEYTNVVNGYGIFASRLIVSTKTGNPQSDGRILNTRTLSELVLSDQITNLENSHLTVEKAFQSRRCKFNSDFGEVVCK